MPEPIPAGPVGTEHACRHPERRASFRHPVRVRAIYQVSNARADDFWWYANIRDVSEKGLSLHVLRRWDPGTSLAMEPMIVPGDAPSAYPPCRVVHATKASEEGGWVLGCEFSQPLCADQLEALLWDDHLPAMDPG